MLINRSKILLFVGVLTFAIVSGDAAAISAPQATSETCDYLDLKLGPAIQLSASDKVSIDQARGLLKIEADDGPDIYDLNKGGNERLEASKSQQLDERSAFADSIPTVESNVLLGNGRKLSISRLYANNVMIKIGDRDEARYEAFGRDLLAGAYCQRPFKELSLELKRQLKPLVTYFLSSEISTGKLDDFESWVKYSSILTTFLTKDEISPFLDIYGYRVAENGRAAPPPLSQMDPNKIWTFAATAVMRILHDPEFADFTDLSIYQRDGKITMALMGSQPVAGWDSNKFGFFTKTVGEFDVSSVTEAKSLQWDWPQGRIAYSAIADLHPAMPVAAKVSQFSPGARNGLIVADATMTILDPSPAVPDVKETVSAYLNYFKSKGYRFSKRSRLTDMPGFLDATISRGDLDFFLREGHSDSDDENVMVAYSTGYLLTGKRNENGREDRIDIVFNLKKKPRQHRIAYADFARMLGRHFAKAQRPLVFIDASCWGIEKAWFGLAAAPPSQLLEIASNTPVNFFENNERSATRVILDGLFTGATFSQLRKQLGNLDGYKSGREDSFVFPDDPLYPWSSHLIRIDRQLFSRRNNKPRVRYTPNGYL